MLFSHRAILLVFTALLFCYCKKPVINESELLPDDKLGVLFTDTLTLVTETVREDSLRTDDLVTNILGKIDEPVFGKTVAGIYMQLRLPANNVSFGNNAVLDSAVLMLQYASGINSYGDITQPMNLVVYEMIDSLVKDSSYFSNRNFLIDNAEKGRLNNFKPNLKDSITVKGRTFAPHIRIKLDNAWVNNKIFTSGSLGNNENFLRTFRGVYVTAEQNGPGNSMVYLDLAAAATSLTLYYKNDVNDTTFSLITDANSPTVNSFKHDYKGSIAQRFLTNSSKAKGDSLVFIQSMAGLKTKITVPHIKNLGNISINKAELVITPAKTTFDNNNKDFYNPNRLIINAIDSIGRNAFVNDQFISDAYFGGGKIQETFLGNSINRYKFNLAIHYQEVLNNKVDNSSLYLLTFPSSRIADRLIAGGGSHSKYTMKLNLTYTKIQ